jgi:hypothetical protein
MDCGLFSSNFHEGMKSDISLERKISFYSSESLIELKAFPESTIGKNEIGFLMKQREKEREEAEFSIKSENESIEKEMNYFREILQLSGGSFWGKHFNVCDVKSNECFEIDSSVENIESRDFFQWKSLTGILFRSDSHLKKIDGFQRCASLCRIEIPSSVEVIEFYGFCECTSLNEVIFSSESHLREIHGFIDCTSLCRIEIPSLVEVISKTGFLKCTALQVVTIRAGCRMRGSKGLRNIRAFIVYESDLRDNRRLVHLGV